MAMDFDLSASTGFLLSRANSSLRAHFNRLIRESGIDATAEQWGLLNIIRSSPGIIQSELAERSMKDRTNVTRMLDLMSKRGLVVRKGDPADRRMFRLFITAGGESLLKQIAPLAVQANKTAVRGLARDEVKALAKLLTAIYHNTRGT